MIQKKKKKRKKKEKKGTKLAYADRSKTGKTSTYSPSRIPYAKTL